MNPKLTTGAGIIRLGNGPSDERRLYRILKSADADYDPPLSSLTDVERYSKKLIANAAVFVGTKEGKDTCVIAIYANDRGASTAYISTLSVLGGHRGEGLGDALLTCAEDYAKGRGMSKVMLETSSSAKSAQGLYRKHGYEQISGDYKGSYPTAIGFEKFLV